MRYANSPSRDEMTWMAKEAWAAGCKLAAELRWAQARGDFRFRLMRKRAEDAEHERNEAWAALEAKEKDYRGVLAENERLARERDEMRKQRDREAARSTDVSCYHGREPDGNCPRESGVRRARKILLAIYNAMEANAAPYGIAHALRKTGRCALKAELLLPIAEWGEDLKGGIP